MNSAYWERTVQKKKTPFLKEYTFRVNDHSTLQT